jgi:hypothetical protein
MHSTDWGCHKDDEYNHMNNIYDTNKMYDTLKKSIKAPTMSSSQAH